MLALLLRRGAALTKWFEDRCGPAFTLPEAAQLLRISADKVTEMDKHGKLIGISRNGCRQYPAWQFNKRKVRVWVAPLCRKQGGSKYALNFLTVRRLSLGIDGSHQSFLAFLLANDPGSVDRLRHYLDVSERRESF